MSAEQTWPQIAVVGAGAVGGYFGGLLARAGAPVTMIGRPGFVAAVEREGGLFLDTLQFQQRVRIKASTDVSAVRGAELVLFCVKTVDNAEMAHALAPVLHAGATVLSLQNGVDNVDQIRETAGIEALPAVVYVAASVPETGRIKHAGRGDLVIGPENERTRRIASIFERAGVACRISENIEGELWTKLVWNASLNAISALGNAKYGRIAADEDARKLVSTLVDEILAVARASGVRLPGVEDPKAALAGALKIASQLTEAYSSTAQDLQRGKRTEIDSLNGFIARRGAALGVPTPVNSALATLVKLAERAGQGSWRTPA